jgi:hypothetical protein
VRKCIMESALVLYSTLLVAVKLLVENARGAVASVPIDAQPILPMSRNDSSIPIVLVIVV